MGWYWHLFEDFLLPWRVCNLGPVFKKISTQFCFYVPALEIYFFFFLHISTLSASTYTFCIFVHMTTAFKASSTKSSRFYGLSYQYQNRKTWLFYFKLFSSREMGLSRYLWPTHFSMEKKKKAMYNYRKLHRNVNARLTLVNTQNLFYALHFCPVVAYLYERCQSNVASLMLGWEAICSNI